MLFFRWMLPLAVATLVPVVHIGGQTRLDAVEMSHAVASVMPVGVGVTSSQIRKVTVNVANAPLATVIDDIVAQGNLRMSYSPALLPKNKTVTLQLQNADAVQALQQVLSGTEIVVRTLAHGELALVKETTPARQQTGTIAGKVIHAETKLPVSGITITLDDSDTRVTTGRDGTFRLAASAGEHVLHIRGIGFVRKTQRVTVASEQAVTIEVVLEPSASVLDQVIVTGTVVETERRAIATPITVITAKDIEERGITRIEQLMRGEIPGLFVSELGSQTYIDDEGANVTSNIYSRGSADLGGGTNPIKTYVDGVELVDPSHLGTIDPHTIERIEIVTGPQAATIYGSGALGGVMQIFTKRGIAGRPTEAVLNNRYGVLENNFSSGKTPAHNNTIAVTGGNGPGTTFALNLSHNYTGQWQPGLYARRLGGSVGISYVQGSVTASGSAMMTRATNGTWSGLSGSRYGSLEKYQTGEWAQERAPYASYYVSPTISISTSQTISINIDHRINNLWQQHLTAGKTNTMFKQDPRAPQFANGRYGAGDQDTLFYNSESIGSRTTLGYNSTVTSRLLGYFTSVAAVGMNGSFGDGSRFLGCSPNKTAMVFIDCAGLSRTLSVTKTGGDENWGGFATWRVGVWDRLFLTYGLRAERNAAYGREHKIDWTPTNGIAYTQDLGSLSIKLQGSYGLATRAPDAAYRESRRTYVGTGYDPYEYLYIKENLDLRPERSRGPQGGVELFYGNAGSFTVNYYRQTVSDLIQQVEVDSLLATRLSDGVQYIWKTYQYRNIAKVRQQGWELTGGAALGALSARGTYSWSDSRILSLNEKAIGVENGEGSMFDGIPSHTGSLRIGYAQGPVSMQLVSNYVGAITGNMYLLGAIASAKDNSRIFQYCECNMRMSPIRYKVRKAGYVKSDLMMTYRISQSATFTMNIVNAANSFASENGPMNPAIGRRSTFGLSLWFPRP